MSGDRSEWLASLQVGDTVTVTHYAVATRDQAYATLTPQHAPVERVTTQHVMVLGQRFRLGWASNNAGHSTSGPAARVTPAEDLPALQLQARYNAVLNTLLPLGITETRLLELRMQSVPQGATDVMTPEIVERLERAVELLATLRADVRAVAQEIGIRADVWWASRR
ncbi:hypothetical protein [Deinococcus radiotolerans]|uniref:Uncharacterized protein n=1 Tax=Deinococcus radiotolerans TaxID=1309407 RepID=A0ABQ2FQ51_9DEIO|nr:hypothetical protein [Deinococcus radiotolerans]GGL15627.1 hypothetical protein GCM10010844_38190 [Deinococcus radiotolerans]